MASRIPPLLEAYLALPPEAAQIVLTGILGASTNWLVLRYLYSFLAPPRPPAGSSTEPPREGDGADTRVLLLSFLRDFAFWKEGASRLGVDLDALGRAGRFGFVDGLSGLFTGIAAGTGSATGPDPGAHGAAAGVSGSARQGPIPIPPGRHPIVAARQPLRTTTAVPPSWRRTLTSSGVHEVSSVLHAAIDALAATGKGADEGEKKVVVVIDQLDFLLAATGADVLGLRYMVLDLRERVYATILTLAADEPLVMPQTATLEREHASLVVSLAHEAELVLSLRLLDTGTAKDVSGVIRINRGGEDASREIEEREYLYHVGGDGGVRAFERGQ